MSLWETLKEWQKPRSHEAKMLKLIAQNQQYILTRIEALGVDTANRLQVIQDALKAGARGKDTGDDG